MLTNDARGKALTAEIIGAAMEVYRSLGAGLREDAYEKALFAELENRGLAVQRLEKSPVSPIDPLFRDILVEDRVAVRIRARPRIIPRVEIAQIGDYLLNVQKPMGLLLNFGRSSIYFKKILQPRRTDRFLS